MLLMLIDVVLLAFIWVILPPARDDPTLICPHFVINERVASDKALASLDN